MREVPWLSRALRTKAPANSGISRATKNQQRWRSRRSSGAATTTVLGDACHPMLPFLAQDAGQAVKDAAALAHCLSAKPAHFRTALARYETARRPHTAKD
jgi:2-polyprenyl-6-methoxyphenol hydroxylase-like FAD-dependent oxidoreductase